MEESSDQPVNQQAESRSRSGTGASRRSFLKGIGAAALASTVPLKVLAPGISQAREIEAGASKPNAGEDSSQRRTDALKIRTRAAHDEFSVPLPDHSNNGDEDLYPNRIGSFSKGLPHDANGEVEASAYAALLTAVTRRNPSDFAAIPLGGTVPLANPQAGLAFDLEGTDSGQLSIPPAFSLASPERAAEMVELYWQAVLRDLPFSEYGADSDAAAAISELDELAAFTGPKQNGHVTAGTLFRGFTAGDVIGPYLSQLLCQPLAFGAMPSGQQYKTELPLSSGGTDYLITLPSWLDAQNGVKPFAPSRPDSTPRFIRSGRDLGVYVHVDIAYQAFLDAALALAKMGAPLNRANPYSNSTNQTGFVTFGLPHVHVLLAEVCARALKAVWYQKWFIHRTVRPEAYGGLVHLTRTGVKNYPVDATVLDSTGLATVFARNHTYLLPMGYPEGCPQHPSYAQGHGAVVGASATVLKWFFDETVVIPNPMVASNDGLALNPYTGSDRDQITVGGEVDKLASNIGIGRDFAGVHWRSDYTEALLLGQAVAISVLADQQNLYNENFNGATFTTFDGTRITV
jgi:hypothetical protein